MRIDSHQHFWRYSPGEYPWIQTDWPIRRDFLPRDLEANLRRCGLDGSVAVQARQSVAESRWLLELADASPWIRGVVGWVDLCSPEAGIQISQFAAHPKFVGVRHVVQDEPDERFMLRPDFQRGIGLLKDCGLTYDILVFPRQLPAAIELARAFPEQPLVLDHLAKPAIRDAGFSRWSGGIRALAQLPNVMCKLSGLVTEAHWHGWQTGDFRPYLELALECFGPDRLMYGSDWPVALLAASYDQTYEIVRSFLSSCGAETEAKVFGENAARFYDL